jgi:hypothetical protein
MASLLYEEGGFFYGVIWGALTVGYALCKFD